MKVLVEKKSIEVECGFCSSKLGLEKEDIKIRKRSFFDRFCGWPLYRESKWMFIVDCPICKHEIKVERYRIPDAWKNGH